MKGAEAALQAGIRLWNPPPEIYDPENIFLK